MADPDKVLRSTTGKGNFQRVSRLLISGGTTLLREVFDQICPPSNLPTILKNPATEKQLKAAKLTKPQWDCLYPSPGVYGKSEDFDVTLLFRLLKTVCNLTPPTTGWDVLPASTDHSLEADLARVKHYRNSVYGHVNQNMEIADDDFPSLWQNITEALVRIAGQISPTKKHEWQNAIDNFLKDPLTAEDERNALELLMWYENDIEVKQSIEKLETSTQKGLERVEDRLETTFQYIKDKLEEMDQSLDGICSKDGGSQAAGARLRLRIDCEVISGPGIQEESLVETLQQHEGGVRETRALPNTSRKRKAETTCPMAQKVLDLAASKYLQRIDTARPEDLNGFVYYLEKRRKVLIVDARPGSLIITVESTSLERLDDLWKDYCTGYLNEMAQKYLVTEDVLKELGLTMVTLTTTISEEEYKNCQEYFLHRADYIKREHE
ncbi:uncharacterized protein LOC144630928 [Oculina patagonica]